MNPLKTDSIDLREYSLLKLGFAFLLLNSLALSLSPLARPGPLHAASLRMAHFAFLVAWIAVAWLAHRTLNRNHPQRDPYLLPIALTLTGWGVLSIWRVSPEFGARQTGWFLVASVVLLELIRSPAELRWIQRYRYLWLAGGILLTSLTLLLGTNPTGAGPRLWLGCCGLYLQPSEPLRLLLIVFLASYLSERMAMGWSGRGSRLLPTLGPLILVWGLSILLLIAQRDLGAGSLFLILFAILLYLTSGRWELLAGAVILSIVGILISYIAFDVVETRIETWLNPWGDPTNQGYQIIQALISFASGGLFGKGPGAGAPGVVPIVHSDFIFSVIVEEWGFLGGLGMIVLFAILAGRMLRSAASASTRFALILLAGIAIGIMLQTGMILGGVMRLLPLTGVTLPFVSYGGSSLLTSVIALGIVLKLSGGQQEHLQFQVGILRIQGLATAGWIALAAVLGWWTLVRAPVLTLRTDNPRRVINQRFSQRGDILDREERFLALTRGNIGEYERFYPWGEITASLGYDSLQYGQSGVEASMDAILRGDRIDQDGGAILDGLLYGAPDSGQDIRLTLDLDFQRMAAEAMAEQKGGVIAIHATRGDILAMVSAPGFDPNSIDESWSELIAQEVAPLLNRTTQGAYQPGLALAPFLVQAATMNSGARDLSQYELNVPVDLTDTVSVQCVTPPTAEDFGTLQTALTLGCPAPFAEQVMESGEDWFRSVIRDAGFNEVPELEFGEQFQMDVAGYEILNLRLEAVGQGGLRVSPLQIAASYVKLLYGWQPPVYLVSAYRGIDGRWNLLQPNAAASQSIEEMPGGVAGFSADRTWSYAAEAVADQMGSKTGWYVISFRYKSMPVIMVVVLEEGSASLARELGVELSGGLMETFGD